MEIDIAILTKKAKNKLTKVIKDSLIKYYVFLLTNERL